MGNQQTERAYKEKRLKETTALAEEQLQEAKEAAEKKKSEIVEAKKEIRENTAHSITNLWSSDGFEALAELSQYINPVTDQITDYEEEEHKIFLLERMIKSPYFARIDFKFDDEDEMEEIYIGRSSLLIIPVYMSKGLEFDAVFICDADSQTYHDEDDRHLLYIACTRALHRLGLFCEKEISPLI